MLDIYVIAKEERLWQSLLNDETAIQKLPKLRDSTGYFTKKVKFAETDIKLIIN